MAYESYKISHSTPSTPQNQMMLTKSQQVQYLYDLAMDREDGCLLNNNPFTKSPRIFNREIKENSPQTITVETTHENDKFYTGDILFYDNDNWLCTSSFSFHNLYHKGEFTLANYTLKFQHPTTGTILSYPCIDESSSSVGIDENSTITTLNGIHKIKLPFDDNTKLIGINKRFFVDKYGTSVAKVTNVNNTEFNYGDKGLIVLTLQQDSSYNPTTDKNGICNYFEPTVEPEPTPSPSGYTLTIASSGDFNLGTTRTLTPTLKDDLGNIVSPWVAVWSIDYNSMNQSYFTITYVGNQCKVTISDEAYDVIDGVLDLTCTVSGDTVSVIYSGIITA